MKNLYPGVNPHLNSRLQSPNGGWESFHAEYIARLADWLEAALPENYYPFIERSLQIGEIAPDRGATPARIRRTRPDVVVFRETASPVGAMAATGVAPTLALPIVEEFDDETNIGSVTIYRVQEGEFPGTPITRIEVLSAANKPGSSYYDPYMSLRRQTLFSGLRLVEIDYLHETQPVLPKIPSYPEHEPHSYPYSILVSDPRPVPVEGETLVYSFRVEDVIPQIIVPLDGEDKISVDFGKVYDTTIERRRGFSEMTDYTTHPLRFETYSEADQTYILRRMAEIAAEKSSEENN